MQRQRFRNEHCWPASLLWETILGNNFYQRYECFDRERVNQPSLQNHKSTKITLKRKTPTKSDTSNIINCTALYYTDWHINPLCESHVTFRWVYVSKCDQRNIFLSKNIYIDFAYKLRSFHEHEAIRQKRKKNDNHLILIFLQGFSFNHSLLQNHKPTEITHSTEKKNANEVR